MHYCRYIRSLTALSILILGGCSRGNISQEKCVDPEELTFFNTIGGYLSIELSKGVNTINGLPGNKVANRDSEIVALRLIPEIFEESTGTIRSLTEDELGRLAFDRSTISLVSLTNRVIEHQAPNGQYFTVKDLLEVVEKTENKTRKDSDWFGGIDIHHIYFEGIHCEDNQRQIFWGS